MVLLPDMNGHKNNFNNGLIDFKNSNRKIWIFVRNLTIWLHCLLQSIKVLNLNNNFFSTF